MTEFFNPYHEWLGIAPGDVTPNHYDLLGVAHYESDLSAIALAADKRLALLREHQNGPHGELLQNLIAEVVHARNTLLDEDHRREYEATLRQQQPSLGPPPLPEQVDPQATIGESTSMALGELDRVVARSEKQRKSKATTNRGRASWFGWLTAALLAGLTCVGAFVFLGDADEQASEPQVAQSPASPTPEPTPPRRPSALSQSQPIDLLALIDPAKHTLAGQWKKENDTLEMLHENKSMLLFPYTTPRQYRITLSAKRVGAGGGPLKLVFPYRDKSIVMTVHSNRASIAIDGSYESKGELLQHRPLLQPDRKVTIALEVTGEKLRVAFDGQPCIDWTIQPERLILPQNEINNHKLERQDCLIANSYQGRFELTNVFLTPLEGTGNNIEIDVRQPKTFEGHSYRLVRSETHTWRQAAGACEEMGGHLVCIESPKELEFLKKEVLHRRPTWLGAMRTDEDSPFAWINGAEMEFANWWKDVEKRVESYLMCEGAEAKWRDRTEGSRMAFVCEWDSPKPTPRKKGADSFLATLVPDVPDDQVEAPKRFAGHTYAIIGARMLWHDAKAVCEKMGGRLCCIESEAEEEFISGMIRSGHRYWLGGTDLAKEGDWKWLTGKPITIDRWRKNEHGKEPNNLGYRGAEHVMKMYLPGKPDEVKQLWLDATGRIPEQFICEWDSEKVAYLDKLNVKPAPRMSEQEKLALRRKLAAELPEEYKDDLSKRTRRQRAAAAAHWIELAKNEKPGPRQYVLLEQAARLAAKNSNVAMAVLACDQLDASFGSDATTALRIQLLEEAVSEIETVWDVNEIAEAASALVRSAKSKEVLESMDKLYGSLERVSRKMDKRLGSEVATQKKIAMSISAMLQPVSAKRKTLVKDPSIPTANRIVGMYTALVPQDWNEALKLLSKSDAQDLAEAAKRCIDSPDDYAAQIAMADAWWVASESTKRNEGLSALQRAAARHWYRQAYPRSTADNRKKIESRLGPPAASRAASGGFVIAMNGLANRIFVRPGSSASGKISSSGGFASIAGRSKVTYPPIPAHQFVHELEFAMAGNEGRVTFDYGRHEFGKFDVYWDNEKKKFEYHFHHHWGGTYWHGPKGAINPGERVKLTIYARPGDWRLYRGERQLGRIGPPCEDLRFQISSGDKCKMQIFRCQFRPLTVADPLDPLTPDDQLKNEGTAQRILAREIGWKIRPSLNQPDRYLVESTGTPMRWIESGQFSKSFEKGKSEVRISRGFWMAAMELSQHEWTRIAKANPSRSHGSPWLPVDGVSWTEVGAFCAKLTEIENRARRLPAGYVYRLPTEMEWEYACRAGVQETHSVPLGNFWHRDTATGLREIGTSAPNAWGLYDMHGNVSEWCLDAFQELPSQPPAVIQDRWIPPVDDGKLFVTRGGQQWRRPDRCGSDRRARKENIPAAFTGFRIVLAPRVRN